jgi:hypothetical protein
MKSFRSGEEATRRGAACLAVVVSLLSLLLSTASARADTICKVKVFRLNLRERPSMSARVSRVLPGQTELFGAGGCNSGWVRVVSDLGQTRGYVAGWALQEVAPEPGAGGNGSGAQDDPGPTMPPVSLSRFEPDLGREPGDSGKAASWVFNPGENSWSYRSSKGESTNSTEALAVQITENRLKVLALERRVQQVERALARLQGRRPSGGDVR